VTHELAGHHHYRWDNSLEPALTVASGDTVVVTCREACDGQFTPESPDDQMTRVDKSRVHSLSGPIAVEGARPGDALAVEFLDFQHEGWAWTSVEPGFGVLKDEFAEAGYAVQIWHVDDRERAVMKPGVAVPIEPFCGCAGVAPAEPGAHSTNPPRHVGGNMDCRHLAAGTTAYYPVEVDGALFSLGDGHLGQGDGEVCGTALETPLTVTVRLSLVRDARLERVRYETTRSTTQRLDSSGYYATTATGPDLEESVRTVVSDMVRLLTDKHDLSRMEAYMLSSVAGDLKIAVPTLGPGHVGVVTFQVPRVVFEEPH
jgi:acetamidase/formamidase